MEIREVDESSLEAVLEFLRNVLKETLINSDIVMNGEYIFDDDILGFLSFEDYGKVAIVRYFIIRKLVEEDILTELFFRIVKKAKSKKVGILLGFVNKENIIPIFKSLGFIEVDSDGVFVDEISIINTKFKDSFILKYEIE